MLFPLSFLSLPYASPSPPPPPFPSPSSVVVDVLDPDCMESACVWKQDILDHTDNNGNVPFLVLVNKMDQVESL